MEIIKRKIVPFLLSNKIKSNVAVSISRTTRNLSITNLSKADTQLNEKNESTDKGLNISESCVKKLNSICETNDGNDKNGTKFLRIIVDGGGCSGFQYKFELDNKINDDDLFFGPQNNVVIDKISLDYCAGSTLDYHSELIKSGFRIIGNPKAEQGCSCGASFSLKL